VVADKIKGAGGRPFLTDTNTLYKGSRSDSFDHLTTAMLNGFDYSCVGCPIIIADGLRGGSGIKVPVKGEILKETSIAKDIADADAMVVVTHFKAHELSGFGGTLKNIGMGCATREGKLVQHSGVAPQINARTCIGCKTCVPYCPVEAITVQDKKASINAKKCIGCADIFQKKMVEYACGALKGKEKKAVFLSFVMQVSPACDCYPHSAARLDIDPVAVDAASCDLVNNEESIPGTAIKTPLKRGEDKWRAVYPSIDWNIQLDHAVKMGLGEREYTLVKI